MDTQPPLERSDALTLVRVLQELSIRYGIEPEMPGYDELHKISTPEDAYNLVRYEMEHLTQEQLRVITLGIKNEVKRQVVVYQGCVNQVDIRNSEILRPAVIDNAPNIIVVHNHPSGDATPSPEDVTMTRNLASAAKLLDIELLDHVIIGRGTFVSLKARNLGFS